MPTLTRAELLTMCRLTPVERRRFEDEIYQLLNQIYVSTDEAYIRATHFGQDTEHFWTQLYRGEGGALAAFSQIKILEQRVHGKEIAIIRGQAGILREYRGGRQVPAFGIERVMRYALTHPGTPLYFCGVIMSPASYAQLWEYADQIWPNPDAEIGEEMKAQMQEVVSLLGIELVSQRGVFLNKRPFAVRETGADHRRWERSEHRGALYYRAMNPDYASGYGLLVLIPVSLGGVLRSAARYAKARIRAGRKMEVIRP